MTYAIEIDDLSKRYDRKAPPVLHDLRWQVPTGAVVGLLGRNGAGKSTLLNCVIGVFDFSGTCRIYGEDLATLAPSIKQRIGFVPQVSEDFPWMRVGELLRWTGSFYPMWRTDWVNRTVEKWGLDPTVAVGKLSPGQRQRLAVIRALGHDPDLVILDEPVAAMDPIARRDFLYELVEFIFASSREKTIVFSTHITSDLERIASHLAILADGQIQLWDTLDQVKERVARIRIYADDDLPQDIAIPGLRRLEHEGRRATALTDAFSPGLVAELESNLDARVSAESLSLEELFLELV